MFKDRQRRTRGTRRNPPTTPSKPTLRSSSSTLAIFFGDLWSIAPSYHSASPYWEASSTFSHKNKNKERMCHKQWIRTPSTAFVSILDPVRGRIRCHDSFTSHQRVENGTRNKCYNQCPRRYRQHDTLHIMTKADTDENADCEKPRGDLSLVPLILSSVCIPGRRDTIRDRGDSEAYVRWFLNKSQG